MQFEDSLCLLSSRDHDSALSAGIALLASTRWRHQLQLQRDHLPVGVWKKERGVEAAVSTCLHNRLHASASFTKFSKKFQSCALQYFAPHTLIPWAEAAVNSERTPEESSLPSWIFLSEIQLLCVRIPYLAVQHVCGCHMLWAVTWL